MESACLEKHVTQKENSFESLLSCLVEGPSMSEKSFSKEVQMDQVDHGIYPFPIKKKKILFLVKWEEVFTLITILCAVSAIGSGIVWLFLKETLLLYLLIGFSSGYFLGKRSWKFRDASV